MKRIWILGAPDPEMEAIESLLRECGEEVVYATSGGVRVHPGNAYRAECPKALHGGAGEALDAVISVECSWDPSWESLACLVTRIDHHRLGDPGFGRPPEDFLRASSLGQVIHHLCLLGVDIPAWEEYCPLSAPARRIIPEPGLRRHQFLCSRYVLACVAGGLTRDVAMGIELSPDEYGTRYAMLRQSTPSRMRHVPSHIALIAAADHCLGAAYAGKCPGVDPVALGEFRAHERARFAGRDVSDVLADIADTSAALAGADVLSLGTITSCGDCSGCGLHVLSLAGEEWDYCECPRVADMRRPEGPWPELPEAGTRAGISYISGPLDCPDGRKKITCSGTRDVVEAFMGEWAPANGLTDIYGDPARGFAGGYQ